MVLELVTNHSRGIQVTVNIVTNFSHPRAPNLLLSPDLTEETLVTVKVVSLDGLFVRVTILSASEVSSHVANRSDESSTVDVLGTHIDHAHLRVSICFRSVKVLTKGT